MTQTAMLLKPSSFAEHPPISGLAQRCSQENKAQTPYSGSVSYHSSERSPDSSVRRPMASATKTASISAAFRSSDLKSLPTNLKTVYSPPATYAVFTHTDHISTIGSTCQAIYPQWLPASGCTLEQEPNFEVYTEEFDPRTGTGLVEIWIPLKAGTAD